MALEDKVHLRQSLSVPSVDSPITPTAHRLARRGQPLCAGGILDTRLTWIGITTELDVNRRLGFLTTGKPTEQY